MLEVGNFLKLASVLVVISTDSPQSILRPTVRKVWVYHGFNFYIYFGSKFPYSRVILGGTINGIHFCYREAALYYFN